MAAKQLPTAWKGPKQHSRFHLSSGAGVGRVTSDEYGCSLYFQSFLFVVALVDYNPHGPSSKLLSQIGKSFIATMEERGYLPNSHMASSVDIEWPGESPVDLM